MSDAARVPDEPDTDASEAPETDPPEISSQQAIYFYGVMRARTWRRGAGGEDEVIGIRYRDLEAIVRPAPFEIPSADQERVREHQRVVENAMRRGTVLPAPYGVVFRGRRQLIRMLQDQYLALDEGLSFFDGHWELRLHINSNLAAEPDLEISDVAMQLYAELRRHARAAVPFAADGRRLMSAAFLVPRDSWIEFMDRAEELNRAHSEVSFDLTGPWPPYDFVRVTV